MPGPIQKSFHDYWWGTQRAHLGDNPEDTPICCWRNSGGLRTVWIDFLNGAFDLYYNAMKNAGDHPTRSKELQKLIQSCANSGYWMPGVTSLYDAFQHITKYNAWKTEDYRQYEGSLITKATWSYPTSAVHFFEKYEEINKEAVEASGAIPDQMKKLLEFKNKSEECKDLTKEETRKATEILEKIKKGSDKAETILWLSGKLIEAVDAQGYKGKVEEFMRVVDKCHRCAEAFTRNIGKVMTGVDLAQEGTEVYNLYLENRKGMSDDAAVMLTLITKAMEYVPIFGQMYAAALEAIPAASAVAQGHADQIRLAMVQLGFENTLR
jgi:hypothetical protein